jgi:hypothetical protein
MRPCRRNESRPRSDSGAAPCLKMRWVGLGAALRCNNHQHYHVVHAGSVADGLNLYFPLKDDSFVFCE